MPGTVYDQATRKLTHHLLTNFQADFLDNGDIVQTPSDSSVETSRRDLSEATIFVGWAPLISEKIVSETHSRVCVILRVVLYGYTRDYSKRVDMPVL